MENVILFVELLGGLVLIALILAGLKHIENRHVQNNFKRMHIH